MQFNCLMILLLCSGMVLVSRCKSLLEFDILGPTVTMDYVGGRRYKGQLAQDTFRIAQGKGQRVNDSNLQQSNADVCIQVSSFTEIFSNHIIVVVT